MAKQPLGNELSSTNGDGMDHDRLFKELLRTFFVDFIELFFPDLLIYLDRDSVTFLDKELFTDVTQGDRHEVDLVAKARFRGQELCFLIHVETQAQPVANFPRRMFNYFARLHELHDLPVYPIAVLSFDAPRQPQPNAYEVAFPDLHVLQFRYRTVQLNELRWADFLQRTNPVAAALMAKMRIDPHDRPRVKLACLRMLAKLQLDPARMQLISGFVDSYLELTMDQQTEFDEQLSEIAAPEQEQVMEIVTSWMKQGIEQGIELGRLAGERTIVMRQLQHRFGPLSVDITERIDSLTLGELELLSEALLQFESPAELSDWLQQHRKG
ncbi:MAG: DUF4351 domain-containing protein [Planctomycetales bacterium]|nr:DUF4351 domain-containing protein [Planctomycetales bacterium]